VRQRITGREGVADQVLEAQKRLMDHHPELIENVPNHEREALRESIEEFYIALETRDGGGRKSG